MGRLSGTLTRDGRLTRGGKYFLRGLGLLIALAGASEWRALATLATGARAAGTVLATAEVPGDQRAYTGDVRFSTADGRIVDVRRPLRRSRGSSAPHLAAGDGVTVAYTADAPEKAVLLHGHENWAGAVWVIPLGAFLVALSVVWASKPATS